MSVEFTLRATEFLLAFAVILQSIEHLMIKADRKELYLFKIILCILLILGIAPSVIVPCLFVLGVYSLRIYQGPYNGGSDRMGLLILLCLAVAHLAPQLYIQEFALAYLALQTVLSYFIAGISKVRNLAWLSGETLRDIFLKSNYPTSIAVRSWGHRPWLIKILTFGILGFEILFPVTLIHPRLLLIGLTMAFLFHLMNGIFLGLNRFVWIWLAAYPSVLWFANRIL